MARQLIQARADDDTVDALEDFADRNDLSRSEAVRRALRYHLGNHGYDFPTTDGGFATEISELEQSISQLEQTQTKQYNELTQQLVTRSSQQEPMWIPYLRLILLVAIATGFILQYI